MGNNAGESSGGVERVMEETEMKTRQAGKRRKVIRMDGRSSLYVGRGREGQYGLFDITCIRTRELCQ